MPVDTVTVAAGDGSRLAVDLWPGGGDVPFLLVHGLASNAQLWWGAADELHRLGHPAAAMDQRGHGRSEQADTGYDLDTACADLVSVLDHLDGLEGFRGRMPVVAGQSWGANVALEVGWRHPERVGGVVCVDGATSDLAGHFPLWEDCAKALAPPRLAGTPLARIEAFSRQAHGDWPESGIRGALANFEVRPDGTVAPWLSYDHHMELLRALWEHRPSRRYPEMKVTVLLVPAGNGRPGKRDGVEAALGALPRAGVRWFDGADHDLHAQFPAELAAALDEECRHGVLSGP